MLGQSGSSGGGGDAGRPSVPFFDYHLSSLSDAARPAAGCQKRHSFCVFFVFFFCFQNRCVLRKAQCETFPGSTGALCKIHFVQMYLCIGVKRSKGQPVRRGPSCPQSGFHDLFLP